MCTRLFLLNIFFAPMWQVPVNTWQHPACSPVERMCVLVPGMVGTASSASARPFVYVAAGQNEVALWNAEDGTCHQVRDLHCSHRKDISLDSLI
jgi:hypothetical protein